MIKIDNPRRSVTQRENEKLETPTVPNPRPLFVETMRTFPSNQRSNETSRLVPYHPQRLPHASRDFRVARLGQGAAGDPCRTVRLALVTVGGPLLAVADAPIRSLFALIGASMVSFGLSVAIAVYLAPWSGPSAAR